MRGELWLLNWLAANGFPADTYTDLDLHVGIPFHEKYSAILISTHPEYWSTQMYDNLVNYMNAGGSVLYLGGNGVFDVVDISEDLRTMTAYGGVLWRTRLFSQIGLQPSVILGVWTPLVTGGTAPQRCNRPGTIFPERVGYRVGAPPPGQLMHRLHPFFEGTGLGPGDLFGTRGWFMSTGEGETVSIGNSGASGGECDIADANSPANLQLLAVGQNVGPHAEMTYYDHPAGGFVFATGSISFCGSLIVDPAIQRLIHNALTAALPPLVIGGRQVVDPHYIYAVRTDGLLLWYRNSFGILSVVRDAPLTWAGPTRSAAIGRGSGTPSGPGEIGSTPSRRTGLCSGISISATSPARRDGSALFK